MCQNSHILIIFPDSIISVCRNYGDDVAGFVELHNINAYLTMSARDTVAGIYESRIDAMIYYAPVITIGNLGALFALLIL